MKKLPRKDSIIIENYSGEKETISDASLIMKLTSDIEIRGTTTHIIITLKKSAGNEKEIAKNAWKQINILEDKSLIFYTETIKWQKRQWQSTVQNSSQNG